MQDSSGAFGVWGPSDADLWLTGYVTDFLTRAKEAGYDVPREGFNQALDRLQNFIAYAEDFEKGGEDRAYALYVLARNGRAPIGDLRYYADTRLDRFSTPLAKAQIGAALAMMGDKERAERAFAAALSRDAGNDARHRLSQRLRLDAARRRRARDARRRDRHRQGGAAEARERHRQGLRDAQLHLDAGAGVDAARGEGSERGGQGHNAIVNGKPVSGPVLRGLTPAQLKDGALTITNNGDTAVDAVISVIGAALTPEPAVSKGFTIERKPTRSTARRLISKSPTGGKAGVKQNDRFVMTVKVTSDEAGGRVLLVDRLPAGFEIENPHLVDSGDRQGLDWLKIDGRTGAHRVPR